MPISGYRSIHVPGYTYTRRFTVKDKTDKPAPKPRAKKAAAKGPTKRKKKAAGGYNFAVPSTGKRVYL